VVAAVVITIGFLISSNPNTQQPAVPAIHSPITTLTGDGSSFPWQVPPGG